MDNRLVYTTGPTGTFDTIEIGSIAIEFISQDEFGEARWVARGTVSVEALSPNEALFKLLDRYPTVHKEIIDHWHDFWSVFGAKSDAEKVELLKRVIGEVA